MQCTVHAPRVESGLRRQVSAHIMEPTLFVKTIRQEGDIRHSLGNILMVIILNLVFYSPQTLAQVYKWVDNKGNTHFGDKPREADKAESAEPVEVIESYRPATQTDSEQAAFDLEQATLRRKTEMLRQEDAEERRVAKEARRARKDAVCNELDERITQLTTTRQVGGVRTFYYTVEEDGKSVTSSRQKEIVATLKQQHAKAGC
ncbi:DUF4124 domain-containing protein [Halieaceae bacterium IMCC11814]|uniref:DUF4124 domain-containing protein n=1 Tax=Candidatus Marimicrobium litorale TaxID=2518991 RepID=A0ABT3T8K6_9GAMM|nr:DUF4124 domain-containing protein [Candidatus Marimicrobium litorale]